MLDIVSHAKSKLELAIDNITPTTTSCGDIKVARDNIIKALGILDLLSSLLQSKNDEKQSMKPEIYHIDNDSSSIQDEGEQNEFTTTNIKVVVDKSITKHSNNQKILFENIVGNQDAKQALYENVVLPLTFSPELKKVVFAGIRKGAGNVLLHGPPGTGKTMLAQAAACEADAVLYSVRPSDILSKYQGESERFLQNLFEEARKQPRAIIFFDEFDSLAVSRGGADEGAQARRLLSELLLQLSYNKEYLIETETIGDKHCNFKKRKADALVISEDVNEAKYDEKILLNDDADDLMNADTSNEGRGLVVIAATNRLEDLDEAIIRRFEAKVLVNVPDLQDRMALISNYMRGIDTNLNEMEESAIGEMTFGWSGSEIEALCRNASFGPIRDMMPILSARTNCSTSPDTFIMRSVTNDDFLRSYNNLMGDNSQVTPTTIAT